MARRRRSFFERRLGRNVPRRKINCRETTWSARHCVRDFWARIKTKRRTKTNRRNLRGVESKPCTRHCGRSKYRYISIYLYTKKKKENILVCTLSPCSCLLANRNDTGNDTRTLRPTFVLFRRRSVLLHAYAPLWLAPFFFFSGMRDASSALHASVAIVAQFVISLRLFFLGIP